MKKLNKKGFTLAELLIVVAIIAVLVAISIPVFTSQLEKAREATDAANLRAAYAEVMAAGLTEDNDNKTKTVTQTQTKTGWQTTITWPTNFAPEVTATKGSWTVTWNDTDQKAEVTYTANNG